MFSDPDGDALTLNAATSDRAIVNISRALEGTTLLATAVTVIGVAEGTATITVTAPDPGATYTVRVRAEHAAGRASSRLRRSRLSATTTAHMRIEEVTAEVAVTSSRSTEVSHGGQPGLHVRAPAPRKRGPEGHGLRPRASVLGCPGQELCPLNRPAGLRLYVVPTQGTS